ncbi:MAG TPA: hypothetical protein VMF69_03910 [Gemmataceae bacterium]|nr:hypothetical protein [Gemmataceae bacterium]
MSDLLKPGDRVRVTDLNRVQGYAAGEKGMVQAVASIPAIGDQLHYQVAMDCDGGMTRAVFTAEEIELDMGPIRGRVEATILPEDSQPDRCKDRLASKPETTS